MWGSVRVSGGFWLLIAWFAWANGWRMLLTVLGASLVHELGHCLVLWRKGARITSLRLSVFGAVLETDSARLSYGGELAAVLAGPAANLLCAALSGAAGVSDVWTGANLVLCAFNLLPVRPLDGGRALYLLLAWSAGPTEAEWAAQRVGACAAAALAAGVVWLMTATGGSWWLLPGAVGLLAAAVREGGAIFRKTAKKQCFL